MGPKVSIITPAFNEIKVIENCILSVVHQDYNNIEHLIIDGGSEDGTVEVIEKYATNYKTINWISEADQGIYDAMNKGIRNAEGEYLFFLGADDIFYNNFVLTMIFSTENITDYEFIYGKVLLKSKGIFYGSEFYLNQLKHLNIPHQAILYQSSIFKKLGVYGQKYRLYEDWLMNIKCFKDTSIKKKFLDLPIAIYDDSGISSHQEDAQFRREKLFYFDDLTWIEKLKKYYFYLKPSWFRPTPWFRKLFLHRT